MSVSWRKLKHKDATKIVAKLGHSLWMIEYLVPIPIYIYLYIYILISNKISLIKKRERHLSTQGVYRGEQIKNEHYKNQVNPK